MTFLPWAVYPQYIDWVFPIVLKALDRCAQLLIANVSWLLTNTQRSWTVFHVSWWFSMCQTNRQTDGRTDRRTWPNVLSPFASRSIIIHTSWKCELERRPPTNFLLIFCEQYMYNINSSLWTGIHVYNNSCTHTCTNLSTRWVHMRCNIVLMFYMCSWVLRWTRRDDIHAYSPNYLVREVRYRVVKSSIWWKCLQPVMEKWVVLQWGIF